MNGDLSNDTQDSSTSHDTADLRPDEDSVDSDKALNLVSIHLLRIDNTVGYVWYTFMHYSVEVPYPAFKLWKFWICVFKKYPLISTFLHTHSLSQKYF